MTIPHCHGKRVKQKQLHLLLRKTFNGICRTPKNCENLEIQSDGSCDSKKYPISSVYSVY